MKVIIMLHKTAKYRHVSKGRYILNIINVKARIPITLPISPHDDQAPSIHPSYFGWKYACTIDSKIGHVGP